MCWACRTPTNSRPQPGNGFLKTDTSTLARFKAAYVSGAYRRKDRQVEQAVVAGQVVPYDSEYVAPRVPAPRAPEAPEPRQADNTAGPTLLTVAGEKLRKAGGLPARQVWLPPLDVPPTLDSLLPPLTADAERGLLAAGSAGSLIVPVGIVDRPFDQRRDPMTADLSGAGGHIGIAGGPQSGKSTMLRTLIGGLALTHTPREVQFYCLDFGGGTLTGLAGLPHVGGVTGRLDPERVQRTLVEVTSLITRRERFFAENGIDSMASYRQRRAAGQLPDEHAR